MVAGPASDNQSLAVVGWLDGVLPAFAAWLGPAANFVVRKCAHFLEYSVMGLLWAQALAPWVGKVHRSRRMVLALVAGVAVAVVDETIQLSVPGRSGQVTDVLLDSAGVAFGIAVAWLAARVGAHRQGAATDKH